MASLLTKIGLTAVIGLAVCYQLILKDLIFKTMGFYRNVEPVSAFPYQCRRIHDPNLHACEDMWLHDQSRQLFLACSDVTARGTWCPNIGALDASSRPLKDHVITMSIDRPKGDSFEYRILKTPDFAGVSGDGTMNVLGMTGELHDPGSNEVRLWLVNTRPSIDATTGALLDNTVIGANSTVELFELNTGSSEMRHVKTFADPQIATPNNIAADGRGGFYFTNDHGTTKTGLKFTLSDTIGFGDVSHCSSASKCKPVASGFKFPNGLIRGQDNLLYVPMSSNGGIYVYSIQPDDSLQKVTTIPIDYPIDNLSQDQNGDIWVPLFPKLYKLFATADDPFRANLPPSGVWKVSKKVGGGYESAKVIEDRDGEALPGSTVAIHDATTGRLFLGGVFSPFVTVCEKL